MKILYHSAPPMADTGYGVHTKNLLPRLYEDHDAAVHSVGGWEGMGIDWQGIQIYPSGAGKFGERSIPYWFSETESDVVFSHHDHWSVSGTLRQMQQSGIPMVLYTILDHDLPGKRPPKAVVEANENALRTVVMSKWAEERMENSRISNDKIERIPHGVNTRKYAPVTDKIPEEELKRDLGVPEDAFVFGMVSANYGPRKNIPGHMQAFKQFLDQNNADDAYFYIHTHPTMEGGYNLYDVRDSLNLDEDRVLFPDPHKKYHGIDDLTVVQLYNTFDVHLNITQSESWGLTITEAMSCGTPVIVANNSAQTEQMGVPYNTYVGPDEQFQTAPNGLLVHRGNEMWTQNAVARRFTASVDDMLASMEYAYHNQDEMEQKGQNARQWVKNHYDWDYLYEEYWQPFFAEVEQEVDEEYGKFYFDRRESDTQSRAFKNEVQDIILNIRGDSVLDVGCGTGTLVQMLEEKGYDAVGVEKADEGIKRCEEKGIEVHQMDAVDLEFKDNSFDTVVSQHVLEHVPGDTKALDEMVRVASKKVIIIVPQGSLTDHSMDTTEQRRYDSDEIERLRQEFETITEYELESKELKVSDTITNWVLTVDVE